MSKEYSVNKELFCKRLKDLRNNKYGLMPKKYTQEELAEKLNYATRHYARFEKDTVPKMNIIEEMAKVLNSNVGFLIGEIDNEQPMEIWELCKLAEEVAFENKVKRIRSKIDEMYIDGMKNRLSPMLGFFGHDVDLKFDSDRNVITTIKPYSNPDNEIQMTIEDVELLIDDIHDYIEFRLYQICKKKEEASRSKEETDDAEEE